MAIGAPSETRLWGRFEHSLDDKFRIIVPQRFRFKLGEEFVLTIGFGNGRHIRVYPMDVWNRMEEQLVSRDVHDEFDPDLVILQRMFGSCEYASYDQQNRLSIPRHLREFAGLQEADMAVIVGSGTRLEVWSRTEWDKLFEQQITEENVLAAAMSHKRRMQSGNQEGSEPTADAVATRGDSAP